MRQKQDPWHKPRTPGNHFTSSEIEVIKGAFDAKLPAEKVAKSLQCSTRSVNRYFQKLREGRPLRKETREAQPIVQTRRGAVDRRYRGSFEL